MGVFAKLGCGCRQRSADGIGNCGGGGQPLPKEGGSDVGKVQAKEEAKRYFEDPLMGAQSEADAETAAELKEQGSGKFKKQQYEEALQLYNEAAQLRPRDPSLWLNRSIVNRHLENWEDAEQDAEIAVELQPSNPKAHYSKALCLQQLGKLQKALASCRTGLEAQPENKALQQLKNVVKRSIVEQDLQKDQSVNETTTAKEEKARESRQGEEVNEAGENQQKASPRRKRKVVQKESKESKEDMGGRSPMVSDEASCPAARIKDNDMQDIKDKANITMFRWSGQNPSWEEREMLKKQLTDAFRGKYAELTVSKENAAKSKSKLQTDQYDKEQKLGLQLKGGHQPMERPEHVDLPADYKEPLGIISLEELKTYSWENPGKRYLISVYGNIFDVSDRPDKYGPDGPYTILTGADITWGLFAGVDTEEYVNRCYDLFKARDMGTDKIAGVCSWLAWYWNEYGDPIGQLEPYTRESELPPPPLQEVDEACTVM